MRKLSVTYIYHIVQLVSLYVNVALSVNIKTLLMLELCGR